MFWPFAGRGAWKIAHIVLHIGDEFVVDRYEDAATGELGPDAEGRQAMTRVTLRPRVVFPDGTRPTDEELDAMHHEAHQECYIANSVKTEVVLEPARY